MDIKSLLVTFTRSWSLPGLISSCGHRIRLLNVDRQVMIVNLSGMAAEDRPTANGRGVTKSYKTRVSHHLIAIRPYLWAIEYRLLTVKATESITVDAPGLEINTSTTLVHTCDYRNKIKSKLNLRQLHSIASLSYHLSLTQIR